MGKPHIYFNIVRRQWQVKRNGSQSHPFIKALYFVYCLNLKGEQS